MRQLKITNKITNRESLALNKYLNDIANIPMLEPHQEIELAQKIKQGDEKALEELTTANLRFVVSVAKNYQNQGLSLSDLINEGNVGLMKAARRFDETRGFKFISYAVWWIRQSILQAIVEYSRMVRLPLNKVSNYNKVNEAFTSFVQQCERDPTHQELADILNIPENEITTILGNTSRHVSVDAPIGGDDGNSTLLDLFQELEGNAPDESLMKKSLIEEVKFGLERLSPREIEILSDYYGLNGKSPHTLEDIGNRHGLTRERVRQIRDRSLRRLKKSYNHQSLRSYL
jgi:RNA polymerase primary sigma factor